MQISCKGKCRNEDEREKRGKLATRLPATKHICISECFSCQALCDSVSSKEFSGRAMDDDPRKRCLSCGQH